MSDDIFIKHPAMPFAECRRSKNSERQYKPHMHKTFSVGAIDQGEVIYRVEGRTAKLRPGSLAIINPETLHACNPAESNKRSYYVLHLDVDWCLGQQKALWRFDAFTPVTIILLEDDSIYQQFINMMDLLMGEEVLYKKEQMLMDFAKKIFLKACVPVAEKIEPSLQIEHLKRQLSMDLNVNTPMNQLSSKLHSNPYTLLRKFKATTGLTPHAYRLNCKIEKAKKLLQQGFSPSQVALECGFFDQSHFHRHFKAMTTVTPGEYQVNFIQ